MREFLEENAQKLLPLRPLAEATGLPVRSIQCEVPMRSEQCLSGAQCNQCEVQVGSAISAQYESGDSNIYSAFGELGDVFLRRNALIRSMHSRRLYFATGLHLSRDRQ